MKIVIVRRTVQLLAFSLLVLSLLWPANPVWAGTYLSSQLLGVALTDPLAALEVMLAGKMVWGPLILSVIPLVALTLLLGRVFCSWICPVNTLCEGASKLKAAKAGRAGNGWLPYWVLTALLIGAAITSLPLFTIVSPIGIVSRAVTSGAGFELIIIGIIILLEWTYGRKAWCRTVCPVGALYGVLGKWRLVTVAIDQSRCQSCRQCRQACTMQVDIGSGTALDNLSCTNCGDCVEACSARAVKFTRRKNRKEVYTA